MLSKLGVLVATGLALAACTQSIRTPESVEPLARPALNTATATSAAHVVVSDPATAESCGAYTCICSADGSGISCVAPDGYGGVSSIDPLPLDPGSPLLPCTPFTVVEPPPDAVPATSCDLIPSPAPTSTPGSPLPAESPSPPPYCDEFTCLCAIDGLAIICLPAAGGEPLVIVQECPAPGAPLDPESLSAEDGLALSCLDASTRPTPTSAPEPTPTRRPRSDSDKGSGDPTAPVCTKKPC